MKLKWMGVCFGILLNGTVVASLLNSHATFATTDQSVKKVVIFGDSLSDTGNLYEYMSHQLPMSPPYYQGRFSNGPIWIEHLMAHYFPKDAKTRLSNYAFGGSGVGSEDENEGDDDFSDGVLLNLDAEVGSYLLAHQDKAEPSSLYIIWMGSNNYLALPDDLDHEVDFTLAGIQRSVELLIQKGAKQVMLVGVPDLGKIPMAREFEYTKELSYLSQQHNAKLEALVNRFQVIYPDVRFVIYQVDFLLREALNHPSVYGFSDVTGTCYDTQNYQTSTQSVLNMVSRIHRKSKSGIESAEDICDTYLFFDPVHPSGRAHQYIADWGIRVLDESGIRFG